VEGLARAAGANDGRDGKFGVGEDVARGEAERGEAERREVRVAAGIAGGAVATVVRLAVDLDREADRQAGEVEVVLADRVLATEAKVAGAGAERTPERNLGRVARAAFAAGAFDRAARGVSPSTTRLRRAVPSPFRGGFEASPLTSGRRRTSASRGWGR